MAITASDLATGWEGSHLLIWHCAIPLSLQHILTAVGVLPEQRKRCGIKAVVSLLVQKHEAITLERDRACISLLQGACSTARRALQPGSTPLVGASLALAMLGCCRPHRAPRHALADFVLLGKQLAPIPGSTVRTSSWSACRPRRRTHMWAWPHSLACRPHLGCKGQLVQP